MKTIKTKRVKQLNFTIVEILVVCVIISILTALGIVGYSYAQVKLKESRTEALIGRISTAIKACKEKHGFYPPSNSSYILIKDLELSDAGTTTLKYKFFTDYANMVGYDTLKSSTATINNEEAIIDAFGRPLYYRYPGRINEQSFDLFSAGADGLIGDPDDNIELWNEFKPFSSTTAETKASDSQLESFGTKNYDDLGNSI